MKKRNTLLRRVLAGALVSCALVGLAGCGKDAEEEEDSRIEKSRDKEEEPTEEPTPTEEQGKKEPKPTEEPEPTEEAEPTEAPKAAGGYSAPTELSDDIYDYQISINGEIIQLPIYVKDLLAQGWEVNSKVCDLSTMLGASHYDLYYFTKNDAEICADVLNWDVNERAAEDCVINGIMVDKYSAKDAEILTAGGLDWKAVSADDIIAAYGTPSYENETSSLQFIRYEEGTHNQVEFQIDLDTNDIYKISLDNFVQPDDFEQGEVSTDIPELTAKYQAPTAFSDDPEDFIFEVEGDLYQLPCPVSEFVNNGWEIVENKSEETIEGRGSGKVTLRKNNFEFWEYVRNYDDNATAIENCFLMDFDVRDQDANISVKIAGGVEYHQSSDDAMNTLEPMGFTFEEGTLSGSGYLELEYGSFRKYELYISGGTVKDISISNELKKDELYK